MHSQSVWVVSIALKLLIATLQAGFTRELGSMLFHLHGICPVSFSLEDQNLSILAIQHHLLSSDWLLLVYILFALLDSLSELKTLPQTEHPSTAVAVISSIVTVSETILVL